MLAAEPVFPSPGWLELYVRVLNSSPRFVETTRGWVWLILFEVREEGGEKGFVLDIADGKCRRHVFLESTRGVRAPYRVWAPKQVWLDMLLGRLEPAKAIMQAKVGFLANQATLGRFTDTLKVLLDHLPQTVA